jgi:hypothetical protein
MGLEMEMRKDIKVLAMHLPQYHAIPENDAWWGKGFTDWVNVKKARPIYKGHKQPVIPLNNNYYDMTDASTLQWQADLAKKYGVYGFCYYHYWFNGKMLLEKPCEILLQHPEIDEHYCFCWANESWARTWDGKNTDILIKQEFGGQDDWKKHIDYLIQFFEDPRYIRIENRPVVFFYSCARITQFNEMISYWNEVLAEHEIPEIYVVEFVNSFNSGKNDINSDVLVEFEHHCATRYAISNIMKAKRVLCKKLGLTDFLSYDYVWKCLLKNKEDYGGKKLWRGAFVGFDNSPRKGKKGMIIKGSNPKKFYYYMKQLLNDTSRNYDDNFVVVNAWNEWAEGAILEPTEQYKYDYLNAIRKLVSGQEHAV